MKTTTTTTSLKVNDVVVVDERACPSRHNLDETLYYAVAYVFPGGNVGLISTKAHDVHHFELVPASILLRVTGDENPFSEEDKPFEYIKAVIEVNKAYQALEEALLKARRARTGPDFPSCVAAAMNLEAGLRELELPVVGEVFGEVE